MAKQYIPLEDWSGSVVFGGEIPQLRPPAFSDDSKYTTFSSTYYLEGLEISDSYIYYPGGSEISEAVVPNISTRLFYALKAIIAFFIRMSHGQGA